MQNNFNMTINYILIFLLLHCNLITSEFFPEGIYPRATLSDL